MASPPDGQADVLLGTITRNQWTDIVIQVRWSHQSDGFIRVWNNGQYAGGRTGPNCYNQFDVDGALIRFKFGLYKRPYQYTPNDSSTSTRVQYIDEVRWGNAAYVDVKPGAAPATLISESFSSSAANFTFVRGGAWSVSNGRYVLTSPGDAFPNGNLVVHKVNTGSLSSRQTRAPPRVPAAIGTTSQSSWATKTRPTTTTSASTRATTGTPAASFGTGTG